MFGLDESDEEEIEGDEEDERDIEEDEDEEDEDGGVPIEDVASFVYPLVCFFMCSFYWRMHSLGIHVVGQ